MTYRIPAPDPTKFPTPTARAVAWLSAIAAIPTASEIHPDDQRLALDTVAEAAGATHLDAFALCATLGNCAANFVRMAACPCGRPDCDGGSAMAFVDTRTGESASIDEAIDDPLVRALVQAIFAKANGDTEDIPTLLGQVAEANTSEILAAHVTAFLAVAHAAIPNISRSTTTP